MTIDQEGLSIECIHQIEITCQTNESLVQSWFHLHHSSNRTYSIGSDIQDLLIKTMKGLQFHLRQLSERLNFERSSLTDNLKGPRQFGHGSNPRMKKIHEGVPIPPTRISTRNMKYYPNRIILTPESSESDSIKQSEYNTPNFLDYNENKSSSQTIFRMPTEVHPVKSSENNHTQHINLHRPIIPFMSSDEQRNMKPRAKIQQQTIRMSAQYANHANLIPGSFSTVKAIENSPISCNCIFYFFAQVLFLFLCINPTFFGIPWIFSFVNLDSK